MAPPHLLRLMVDGPLLPNLCSLASLKFKDFNIVASSLPFMYMLPPNMTKMLCPSGWASLMASFRCLKNNTVGHLVSLWPLKHLLCWALTDIGPVGEFGQYAEKTLKVTLLRPLNLVQHQRPILAVSLPEAIILCTALFVLINAVPPHNCVLLGTSVNKPCLHEPFPKFLLLYCV